MTSRREKDSSLREELRAHIEMGKRERTERGEASAAAEAAARRELGNLTAVTEATRESWGWGSRWLERTVQDLRFAARQFARRPGFFFAVVATLALGIGANAAVFTVVDAVLLHPLRIAKPDAVVAIYEAATDQNRHEGVAYPTFRALAERTHAFAGIAAVRSMQTRVRSDQFGQTNEQVVTGLVSGNYFSTLGVRAQVGRLLMPFDDDAPGAHAVVVLSDGLWTSAFNRDTAIVGKSIAIGGNAFTVVGVAEPHFAGTDLSVAHELWVPATMLADLGLGGIFSPDRREALFSNYALHVWSLVGRLRAVGAAGAQAAERELNAVLATERREHPIGSAPTSGYAGHAVENPMNIMPVDEAATSGDRPGLMRFLSILAAVVGLTLLIACVNVANLLAIRAGERTREFSMRASLGASRRRIAQQLIIESVLLATTGAAAGVLLDVLAVRLLSTFTLPGNISLASLNLTPSLRVIEFTGAVALLTAVVFGFIPAIAASRPDLITALKGSGRERGQVRALLLGGQVAMSLTLLVGAALFVRSMQAGLSADIGFDPRQLAAVTVNPALAGYHPADIANYYAEARSRAARIPGVTGVALSSHVPLAPAGGTYPFVAGPVAEPNQLEVNAAWVYISPNYFDVLGLRIADGRAFTDADTNDAPGAVIVNQSAAKLLFPDGHSIGRDVMHAGSMHWTVVGIVPDTKYESVRDDHRPMVFVPMRRAFPGDASIVVRSGTPRASLASLVHELTGLAPNPPLRKARVVSDQVNAVLMPQRFGATLLGLFSFIALAISAVGIYGMVAYTVNRQRREIGIRIALGARRADVLRIVGGRTGAVIAYGVAAGIVGAVGATRALDRFLYGVTALDLASFAGATVLMSTAAAVAFVLPMRRALKIDPVQAIRTE